MDGQHGEDRLDATGRPEQVPGHRLGGIDDQPVGVIAEGELDRLGLVLVAERRGRAVCVHVLDLVGIEPCVAQCRMHPPLRAVAVRRGDVVRIRAHAVSGQLAVDARAAPLRVLVLFEDHYPGALAQHEAVAVLVPGAAGGRRIVVAGGHRPRRAEAADAERRDRRLGAAADHHVGVSVLDQATRIADRMQAGGAGRDDRVVRPLEAVHDRHLSGDHVDDRARHEEGRDPARAAIGVLDVVLLDHRQAADARPHDHAHALGIHRVGREAGVLDRLGRGCDAVMDERVEVTRLLGRHPVRDLEPADFARDAGGERGGIELGDGTDPPLTGNQAGPARGDVIAHGADQPEASDDDSTTAHSEGAPAGCMRDEIRLWDGP